MKKVIIIGGGIAGLAAAHLLSKFPFDIEIYEKENIIGGQASSKFSQLCHTEYSWRIFGSVYHNLMYIINEIGAANNFTPLVKPCLVDKDNINSAQIDSYNLAIQILKQADYQTIDKLIGLIFLCRERAINDYDHISAYEYFNKDPIMQTILGPFLGLEANKVSLSAFLKNIYSTTTPIRYPFSPKGTQISKYPTQQSLFIPWKNYLIDHGVKIYTGQSLEKININNECNFVESIIINGTEKQADEYIFACSLKNLLNVFLSNNCLKNLQTTKNMMKLQSNLQLYFTINLYFSEELGSDECDKGTQNYCSEFIIVDMPWKPIIQKKKWWKNNYLKDCDPRIKDVWNVGFLDYNKGVTIPKMVRNCSKEEAIREGLYQVKNSEYIKKLLRKLGKNFDDILVGVESWHQFQNDDNNKLVSLNPKFSINQNTYKLMPNANPADLPQNMFLAGYYVNNTMGGISMESSCETGLNAAQAILDEYEISNDLIIPIKHNNQMLVPWSAPLVNLDKTLYDMGLKPVTHYVDPSTIFLIVLIIIVILIIYFIKKMK